MLKRLSTTRLVVIAIIATQIAGMWQDICLQRSVMVTGTYNTTASQLLSFSFPLQCNVTHTLRLPRCAGRVDAARPTSHAATLVAALIFTSFTSSSLQKRKRLGWKVTLVSTLMEMDQVAAHVDCSQRSAKRPPQHWSTRSSRYTSLL